MDETFTRLIAAFTGARLSPSSTSGLAEAFRSWCLVGAGFREWMLRLVATAGQRRPGEKVSRTEAMAERNHGMNEARRIEKPGLIYLQWWRQDLAKPKKGDERKAAMAAWLRPPTALPNV